MPDSGAPVTRLLCGAYGLDQSRPHPLLRDLPPVVHLPARVGRHPSLRTAIDLLGSELEQKRPGSDAVVPALVDVLLLYILRSWYDEQDADHRRTGWAGAFSDPGISAALEAMHTNPRHPWTLEVLACRAGMSRAVFARRFNSLAGEPPLTYLTQWRMRIAARLLRETKLSLAAVGEDVGYTSAFAFAKAFKREFGTAPGTYRTQNR
jgi:AraC-like DNA-binding protein